MRKDVRGWRKRNREAVGAGSPCPPPIYRPGERIDGPLADKSALRQ